MISVLNPKFNLWRRKRLFNMINDLPTVFEVVTGAAKKQQKDKSSVSNHSSNKSKPISKAVKRNLSCVIVKCGYQSFLCNTN